MKLKVHPAISHAKAMMKSVPERTGKILEEWSEVVAEAGGSDSRSIINFLKSEYDLGRPTAMVIASYALDQKDDFDADAYLDRAPQIVDAQYDGKKAHLRPLADELFELIGALGPDVAASPCKTYVPFYRHHVFAQVKAATQKRVDVGLALGSYSGMIPDRLSDTGGMAKGDRITHVIAVSGPNDIDDELHKWLKCAYELDAE